ncbi:MAG: hypothetical protein WAL64_09225 [Candidatus Dormiibacterota bacterium]
MRISRFAAPEGPRFAVADSAKPSSKGSLWLDLVEVRVDPIGILRNPVEAEAAAGGA